MHAVRFHEHGGPEVLRDDELDAPEPGEDELLVRVEAAGINPVDTYFREGSYRPGDLPWTPGSDVAGVVEAVGSGVSGFETGDRVFATGLGNQRQGTCAEYVAVPTGLAAELPAEASFEEGAALALVGVTAWQSLVTAADLRPAETCLVHGGSGGVGHVAVQLAAATGATVLTTAAPAYHDRLEELGADAVFDYARDDLAEAVGEAGAPDVVLDHRLDEYLDFDATVAAQGARVAGIGNTRPEAGFENVAAARAKELEINLISMFNTPDMAAVLDDLATLVAAGDLTAEVAETYDLSAEAVGRAHEDVLAESFLGKLVVVP